MNSKIEVLQTVRSMRARSEEARRKGLIVGCVPTMGYLHEGHLSLIGECARRSDLVVMTLFVNPTQFAPGEDLDKYPRDFEGDLAKARGAGAHAVFYPGPDEMYPEGYRTFVTVEDLTRDMEGASRPTHFRGVATVVTKLFGAVRPHLAVFGEKDFQQLKVIERASQDLNLGVEIIGMPTVREPDGLAMSSRNVYLSAGERARALSISGALFAASDAVEKGALDPVSLALEARRAMEKERLEVDYVEVRDERTLDPIKKIMGPARMLAAARVGKTRLIDNVRLGRFENTVR